MTTHPIQTKEVTPQSLRALERHIDTRGPEELRDALVFLHHALAQGRDVVITSEVES